MFICSLYFDLIKTSLLPKLVLRLVPRPHNPDRIHQPAMEPADQFREAIRLRGICLEQRGSEISALHQSMDDMRATLKLMFQLVTPQMTAQPALPPPPGVSPWHGSEPRLPAPERYEGDPWSYRPLFPKGSLPFELQPSSLPVPGPRAARPAARAAGPRAARPAARAAGPRAARPAARAAGPRAARPAARAAGPRAARPAARAAGPRAARPAARAAGPRAARPAARAAGPRAARPAARAAGPRAARPAARAAGPRAARPAARAAGPRAARPAARVSRSRAAYPAVTPSRSRAANPAVRPSRS